MSSTHEIIEAPVVETDTYQAGKVALTHLNTWVMRFGNPEDNYAIYTDEEGKVTDTFVSDKRFQELIDLHYPSFYLPSIELAEWWRKDPVFIVNGMGRAMRPQRPEI